MSVLKEFREFAIKGNVVDMAVGIIIGAAFTTVVRSLVDDIIMPPIGVLLGGMEFKDLFLVIRQGVETRGPYATLADAQAAGAATLNYGLFVNAVVAFTLTSLAVFMLVKSINRLRREEQAAPQAPPDTACPFCTTTIPIRATRCPNCTSQLAQP